MTKEYEKKPNARLFAQNNAGKPKLKDGKPLIINGRELTNGIYKLYIDLPESLAAGEYETELYVATSKAGTQYFRGNIKKKWQPQEQVDAHNQAKANGYQPEAAEIDDGNLPF